MQVGVIIQQLPATNNKNSRVGAITTQKKIYIWQRAYDLQNLDLIFLLQMTEHATQRAIYEHN